MTKHQRKTNNFLFRIGISLLIVACLLWISLLMIPFLPLSYPQKAGLGTFVLIAGEIAFWLGVLLTGKEFVAKYKKYLNPKNWKKYHTK